MSIYFAKDIHKLKKYKNKPLILAGVNIKNAQFEIVAHSDGDLIIHTIISCLLAAMNKKTIGEIYPDNDEKYKNCSSATILIKLLKEFKQKKLKIENIDLTIVCEKIILKDHIPDMIDSLQKMIGIKQISLKATRYEDATKMYIESNCIISIKK